MTKMTSRMNTKGYHFTVDERYQNQSADKIPSYALLDGFGQNTSAHGISHISKAKGKKKIYWIFFTICSVGLLFYYGETLFAKFFGWPVQVLVSVQHAPELTFPAITVCNMNPVRMYAIKRDLYIASMLGMAYEHAGGDTVKGGVGSETVDDGDGNATTTSIGGVGNNVSSGGDAVGDNSGPGPTTTTLSPPNPPVGGGVPNGIGGVGVSGGGVGAVAPTTTHTTGSTTQNTTPPPSIETTTAANAQPTTEPAGRPDGTNFKPKPKNKNGKNMNARFELGLQFTQYIAELDEESKMAMGHQMEDFILKCDYAGYECEMRDFYPFYNSKYGNCFIFNSGWNFTNSSSELELSKRPGPEYGLSMIFNIDQDEYVGSFADAAGVRVVVHSQDSMPFPEDEGIVIGPGSTTFVGITKEEISRKSSPYGDCVNIEDITTGIYERNVYQEIYPVSYTTSACLKTCVQKFMMSECNCADSAYPVSGQAFASYNNISICDYTDADQSECAEEVMTKYKDGDLPCDCSTACDEGVFTTLVSSAYWPSNAYRSEILSELSENRKASLVIRDHRNPDKYKENFVKVTMYYEEFNFKTITEVPAYAAGQFVSDIGGILGLFIGFSALTILEFVELLFDAVVLCAFKLGMLRDKSATNTGNGDNSVQPEKPERIMSFNSNQPPIVVTEDSFMMKIKKKSSQNELIHNKDNLSLEEM